MFVLAGVSGIGDLAPDDDASAWLRRATAALEEQAPRAADPAVFRPLGLEAWICGVHFLDRVLGARVYRGPGAAAGDTGGWWNDSLATPIGALRPPDLATHPTWRAATDLAQSMVRASTTVPFLSTQVLSSPLNIAVNLYGEAFLVALYEAPDAARHDLRVIADTIRRMHAWYRGFLPATQFQPAVIGGRCQPRGCGQICGCATQLLSAELYRDFLAPLDAEILASYPRGGMIHLCGSHTQHIPVWREMQALRAIQVNDRAAEDLAAYFTGLREDQIIYWSPTARLPVAAALRLTGGRRLVIAADLPQPPRC